MSTRREMRSMSAGPRTQRLHLLFLPIMLILTGCAAPVPEGKELGSFVPTRDIVSVELLREGMSLFDQNRFGEAELRFRSALYLNPGAENIQMNLAVTLEKQGLYSESEALLNQLLQRHPQTPLYLAGLARNALGRRDFKAALSLFEQTFTAASVRNEPAFIVSSARSMASIYLMQGAEDEALCWSSRSYTLNPIQSELLLHAQLLNAVGHYRAALQAIGGWAESREEIMLPLTLHTRALAAFGLNDFQLAQALELSALLQPNVDPALKVEMSVAKALSERALSGGNDSPDNDEEKSWRTSQFIKDAPEITSRRTTLLSWPPNLIDALNEAVLLNQQPS